MIPGKWMRLEVLVHLDGDIPNPVDLVRNADGTPGGPIQSALVGVDGVDMAQHTALFEVNQEDPSAR